MLYGFLRKHIYWQEGKRYKFKAFHVTPYLNEILTQGELLPPTITKKSVLGENEGQRTIRGCLLSFFDDFQTAMNGCYTLALYAILDKKLLSEEDFEILVRSEISKHGISDDESLEDTPEDEIIKMLLVFYRFGETSTLFHMLGRALEPFKNPVILTDGWVSDLPNDIDGILDEIGVLEVEFDCKYIADPSTIAGGYESRTYGYASAKGDFDLDQRGLSDLYHDSTLVMFDEEAEDHAIGYASTEIAQYINRVCESTSAQLTDQNVERELENTFGDLDEFEESQTQYGKSWVFENEVTFVSKVTIDPQDLVIWNPAEHEWRIPAPNGIKVDASNVVALAGDVTLAVSGESSKFDFLVYKESEVRGRRKNPSREWFKTQSLQNDENGFLINPDTNDIYWYHGSKYGGLGDGHVLYFSSDIDIARTMACQMFCYSEDDCTTTVYTAKLKARADEIFDARYADSSNNAKSLAERLNLEHPYYQSSLDFDNFDEKLGYRAQTDTDIAYAQSLGFKGWLEVEDIYFDPEPCTIGLFTNSMTNYEIVETVILSKKECKGFY